MTPTPNDPPPTPSHLHDRGLIDDRELAGGLPPTFSDGIRLSRPAFNEFGAALAEAAPGLELAMRDGQNRLIEIELRRRVEGRTLTISTETVMYAMDSKDVLVKSLLQLLQHLRDEAIRDYGLRPLIDAEVTAGREDEREQVRAELAEWIERQRPTYEIGDVSDPDNITSLPGDLPPVLQWLVAEWHLQ